MKKIPVIFLMTYALLIPAYSQGQNIHAEAAAPATNNNQNVIQADSIRKPSQIQKENVEQPQVQMQQMQNPSQMYSQGQGQVYYVQPYVQYYTQPNLQEQNDPVQYHVDRQGQSYQVQQNTQAAVYYAQPNSLNGGYFSNDGQGYYGETYPQAPIFIQEQNNQACNETPIAPPREVTCCSSSWMTSLEFRIAAFCPLTGTLRRIYDSAIPFYQFEANYGQGGPVSAWFNVGYLGKSGRSQGEEDRTNLRLVPIGLGLKYSFYLPYCWQGYIGAGPAYSFLTIHDHSDFNHHIHRDALGAMAKLGFTYEFWRCAFLDLFIDYYYTEFKFSGNRNCARRNNLDVSALIVGAGIGWAF